MSQNFYRRMAADVIQKVINESDSTDNIVLRVERAYPFASRHDFLLKIWNEEKTKARIGQLEQQNVDFFEQLSLWN